VPGLSSGDLVAHFKQAKAQIYDDPYGTAEAAHSYESLFFPPFAQKVRSGMGTQAIAAQPS
jgi:hypothetical protein